MKDSKALALVPPPLAPARVTVLQADGSTRDQVLEVHPLALLVPSMSEKDDQRMRADILVNGVREPLVMLGGKVLDGRNRLRVASQEGIPVRLEGFSGTEADARAYVWSVNVARRHLSIPQLALTASRFGFVTEAKARAGRKWAGEASRKIGGAVTPRTLQRFDQARVTEAPATVARIDAGKLRRMDVVVKSAAAELGIMVPPPVARTPWDRLGCARGDVLAAERAVLEGESLDITRFAERAREIQASLLAIDRVLRLEQDLRSRARS